MYINERKVKAVHLKDVNLFYVELLLAKGDCPEKREFPDIQLCSGDCQGTYLSAAVKNDVVRIIGSIYPKPHIMYGEEFVRKHNLKREEIAEYVESYLVDNPCTTISYMGGRKKRIYVREEHVKTVFERCVFRIAQGEFADLLTKLREKDLREITQNLAEIKKIAILATTAEFSKKIGG